MARYTGPSCRLCRREGCKLHLKGERCNSDKCSLNRRAQAPGQHGAANNRRRVKEYSLQLREKQRAKFVYGVEEKQFRNTFNKAAKKKGITGENLLIMLEKRLDNVVYRMGLSLTRREARQLVVHSHFLVNGKKVNIPSYQVKAGDVISVKAKSLNSPKFKEIKEMTVGVPEWLSVDRDKMEGKVLADPTREQIDTPIEERLIVELYSK